MSLEMTGGEEVLGILFSSGHFPQTNNTIWFRALITGKNNIVILSAAACSELERKTSSYYQQYKKTKC